MLLVSSMSSHLHVDYTLAPETSQCHLPGLSSLMLLSSCHPLLRFFFAFRYVSHDNSERILLHLSTRTALPVDVVHTECIAV